MLSRSSFDSKIFLLVILRNVLVVFSSCYSTIQVNVSSKCRKPIPHINIKTSRHSTNRRQNNCKLTTFVNYIFRLFVSLTSRVLFFPISHLVSTWRKYFKAFENNYKIVCIVQLISLPSTVMYCTYLSDISCIIVLQCISRIKLLIFIIDIADFNLFLCIRFRI